jgi:single-strand DNA-binding protein
MSDMTTLTGVVATIPDHRVTGTGLAITSFRLACSHRRFDKETKAWVDGETNWYTVSAFRHLAFNTARSLRKGEHVLVTGRLHVRNWAKDDRRGTNVEVEADAIGHDLFWCTTVFARSAPQAKQQPYSERYGSEVDPGGGPAFDPNTQALPPAPADWMASPDRDPVGWPAVDTNIDTNPDRDTHTNTDADGHAGADGTDEIDETDGLLDSDPEYPYETSADGYLPASETGMATIDS